MRTLPATAFRRRAIIFALILAAFVLPGCREDGDSLFTRMIEQPLLEITGINPDAPAAPTGLWAAAASSTRVNLGWTDNATNESGYKVFRRKGSGNWVLAANLPAGSASYSCTGLKPGKNYSFKVMAYNSAGKGVSNIASATTYPSWPISAPSSLFAWADSMTAINLTWSDGSNNELGFKIERRTGLYGSWSQVAAVGENVTAYTSTGLAPETLYYFRVRAYNKEGNSAYSDEASTTSGDDLDPPSKVVITPTIVNATRIDLVWTEATDNYKINSYDIYRDETLLASNAASLRSYYDGGVPSPAIDYCYVVEALDTVGNATPSDPACVHTNGLSVSFTVFSTGSHTLGLNAASDGTNFLAGLIGDTTSTATERALLLNPRARREAPVRSLAGSGGLPSVAWNGNHYLVAWPDDGGPTTDLKGQFLSAAGDTVGAVFTIAAGVEGRTLAAGGGKCLAVYTVEDPVDSGRGRLWGRFISDGGTVGGPIALTGDTVAADLSLQAASFNGYGFLVTFVPLKAAEGYAPYRTAGKFISVDGVAGTQVTIDSDADPTGSVVTGFGNGQHLVAWTDQVGTGNTDVFARLVSPLGNLGATVAITTAAGRQLYPGVASDGSNFLVSWVDAANDLDDDQVCDAGESTCWDLRAQGVTVAGALSGSPVLVAGEAASQWGMPVFGAARYFFLISNFNELSGTGPFTVTGRFLTP